MTGEDGEGEPSRRLVAGTPDPGPPTDDDGRSSQRPIVTATSPDQRCGEMKSHAPPSASLRVFGEGAPWKLGTPYCRSVLHGNTPCERSLANPEGCQSQITDTGEISQYCPMARPVVDQSRSNAPAAFPHGYADMGHASLLGESAQWFSTWRTAPQVRQTSQHAGVYDAGG